MKPYTLNAITMLQFMYQKAKNTGKRKRKGKIVRSKHYKNDIK